MSIQKLKELISASKYIVFFGGAGVSTESDIPDFRSENGIYRTQARYGHSPEEILSHTFFTEHPHEFYDYYRNNLIYRDAKPNKAHLALAELERRGVLKAVATQNIDGLHQLAGSREVLELHGSIYRNYCMECGEKYSLDYVMNGIGRQAPCSIPSGGHSAGGTTRDSSGVSSAPPIANGGSHLGEGPIATVPSEDEPEWEAGRDTCPSVPKCGKCGGIVRPDVTLYEEDLDMSVLNKAVSHIRKADMLIVGGTSLAVYPAAGLIYHYTGDRLVLINKSPTPYDRKADLVFHDSIGDILGNVIM